VFMDMKTSNVLSRFQRNIKAAGGKEDPTNAMGTVSDRIEAQWNRSRERWNASSAGVGNGGGSCRSGVMLFPSGRGRS
jgi:ribosome-associated translation inhibitor RaiA